jgi:hypothetical protein
VTTAHSRLGLELNEFLLYHGAPSDVIKRLQLQGLDPRYAGEHAGKMFGSGLYFATNSSKSDLYTKPDGGGLRCLLVVRVCLGEPHRASDSCSNMKRPPERPDACGPLSSVVGLKLTEGGKLQHREYVVYRETQTLPQYAVWYRHSATCKCTHCAPH